MQPLVRATVSGRSQSDGPQQVTDLGATEANRALVTEFAEKVLKGADFSVVTNYVSITSYQQHDPEAADGRDGWGAAVATWAKAGKQLSYGTIHKIIAEGDFVLLQSEANFGGPVSYYDLFRVQDGAIVEHWEVIAPVPEALPHGNGLF
jgi:predicted SnoaL-like aldol condensation-catalyzing enzyme